MIGRTGQGNSHASRRRLAERPGPVHIEELIEDHDDLFATETAEHSRWLLSACVAGISGTVIVAATLLGLFGLPRPAAEAFASVQPAAQWQEPAAGVKVSAPGAIAARKEVSVVYRKDEKPLGFQDDQTAGPTVSGVIGGDYPTIPAQELPYTQDPRTSVINASVQPASLSPDNITTITKTPPPEPTDETITLEKGDTLIDQLVGLGVTRDAARSVAAAIEPVYPSRLFKAGQSFTVTLDRQQDFYGNDVTYPVSISFAPDAGEEITVESDGDGQFVAHVGGDNGGKKPYFAGAPFYHVTARISSSVYAAARDAGVPDYIIAQVMHIFSYDVDFQRQIHPGDELEIFYGVPLTGSSRTRKVVHYASLTFNGGQTKTYYRFTTPDDNTTGYYDMNGRNATKFLMRTPANGARMTSGFGMRKHPILGYSKMHTGVDFGLPYGTPIRAAGAGVIAFAGRDGGYGNMVRIDHGRGYATLYAHMSRIASGITDQVHVNQGQVIGYVGSTGRSTGPHLHYEVRVHDKPVNPLKVRVAGGRTLSGKLLAAFQKHERQIVALMDQAPVRTKVASAGN